MVLLLKVARFGSDRGSIRLLDTDGRCASVRIIAEGAAVDRYVQAALDMLRFNSLPVVDGPRMPLDDERERPLAGVIVVGPGGISWAVAECLRDRLAKMHRPWAEVRVIDEIQPGPSPGPATAAPIL